MGVGRIRGRAHKIVDKTVGRKKIRQGKFFRGGHLWLRVEKDFTVKWKRDQAVAAGQLKITSNRHSLLFNIVLVTKCPS